MKRFILGDMAENTYIIELDNSHVVVIDPGEGFRRCLPELKDKIIDAVLITHGHFDHLDGISYLTDYPIYISADEQIFLKNTSLSLYKQFSKKQNFKYEDLKLKLIEKDSKFLIGSNEFSAIKTPGHTIGGLTYIYKSMIFTGDTLFKGSIGRTDFPSGNMNDIIVSIHKILDNFPDDFLIYPGHGESSSVGIEKKINLFYKQ